MAYRNLTENGNFEAAYVIRNSELLLRENYFDSWNGGTYYWDIVFCMRYRDYVSIKDRKADLESTLDEAVSGFHNDEYDHIANVIIEAKVEQLIDWNAVRPETKQSVITLINDEVILLEAVATGRSYKEDGLEEEYRIRHQRIITLSEKAGFDYPNKCNSLAEWWIEIRDLGKYAERRARISEMFGPVITQLQQTDDSETIDFAGISEQSTTIFKAISDAELFFREDKYDSAVDRIHTVLHGYLRNLLDKHGQVYTEGESIAALYSKLHSYYGINIQPPEVAVRIKEILRSGSGMITKINELRNNNTVAHANEQLIQKREAQLVIRLINALVYYIDDIEKTIDQ